MVIIQYNLTLSHHITVVSLQHLYNDYYLALLLFADVIIWANMN